MIRVFLFRQLLRRQNSSNKLYSKQKTSQMTAKLCLISMGHRSHDSRFFINQTKCKPLIANKSSNKQLRMIARSYSTQLMWLTSATRLSENKIKLNSIVMMVRMKEFTQQVSKVKFLVPRNQFLKRYQIDLTSKRSKTTNSKI